MTKKTLFFTAAASLLLAFIAAAWFYSAQQEKAAAELAAINKAALVRMHAPTLGPSDAPVVIVEFIDPACETCRAFYPLVKQMMAANPEHIRLVMRYAPFHPGSERVVAALEAARRQGKFWPALETLLSAQGEWTQNHTAQIGLAWKHLEQIGLDMERLAFDMSAPEIARVIEQDLQDARRLNVSKTPEFFVNGKPLPNFGAHELRNLVNEALAVASRR